MKPLSGRGQSFTAKVEENGVKIDYESGGKIKVNWCYWRGAIQLLCQKASLDSCVEVRATRGEALKGTIEGAAQSACGIQLNTATWMATILENLDLVYVCQRRPLGIKLTEKGKEKLCKWSLGQEGFNSYIASVLKDIEK